MFSFVKSYIIQKATPVIIDSQKMDLIAVFKEMNKRVTNKTKAIIQPYMFDLPANINKIMSLGIPVIEDCTLSLGGKYKGKLLGLLMIQCFVFYATKVITAGDGGMLLINNKTTCKSTINH